MLIEKYLGIESSNIYPPNQTPVFGELEPLGFEAPPGSYILLDTVPEPLS